MGKRFINGELHPGKTKLVLDEEERVCGMANLFAAAKQAKVTARVVLEKVAGRWFKKKEIFLGKERELTESKQEKMNKLVKKLKEGKLSAREIEEVGGETE